MRKIVINIGKLVQIERGEPVNLRSGRDMSILESIDDAYLVIEGERIDSFGKMSDMIYDLNDRDIDIIDARGRMVFPSFCDSHTHLVYSGSREIEYIDKIKGLSYQEIAKRGGGILNSVKLLHDTDEKELYRQTLSRAEELMRLGTGAVEIKSGYGLTLEDEIKMLRVAKMVGENTPLTVKTTFMGAHAVPERYRGRQAEYVDEIINTMIPIIASEDLAEYIDVFCEDGFFTVEDTDRIFSAGIKYGLRPKVHANQMGVSGGVQVGVKYGAISVDHLESTGEEEFKVLKGSDTIATMLPGATFFLDMDYAPARRMVDYGLPIAIATNYNPGSCPSGDMKFMLSLASIKMKLTPEEALNGVTINGAYAMGISNTHGSIAAGKIANFFIARDIPSIEFIPYAFSTPLVDRVFLKGVEYI